MIIVETEETESEVWGTFTIKDHFFCCCAPNHLQLQAEVKQVVLNYLKEINANTSNLNFEFKPIKNE